ncbi:MAG: DUF3332 domain-containing protein [Bacteroidota bacterium]|nr:DUF3332 domain-containing protein [Bacteroidota bacterium]
MNKFSKTISVVCAGAILSMSTGCFGEFALIRKLYTWNQGLSSSRFVQTLVFYALNIIPVYGIAGAIDFIILNLIEFWTGNNPAAMAPGEYESQEVVYQGTRYLMEATQNQMKVTNLDDNTVSFLRYNPDYSSWSVQENDAEEVVVARTFLDENGNEVVAYNTGDGELIYTPEQLQAMSLTASK